jgi:hypothetical protein
MTLTNAQRDGLVGKTIFDSGASTVSNRSVDPSIFHVNETLSNAKLPDSLAKANAVRRGASAHERLKSSTLPIGFTGHVHPLTEDAEAKTSAALANDDAESHTDAAEAHTKAAAKMAGFLKETSGKNRSNQIAGLKNAHTHHVTRAQDHTERAAYLDNETAKTERADAEKDAAKKAKKDKK